jgi:hypothetical protein
MSSNRIAALKMKMKGIKMLIIIKKIYLIKRIFIFIDRYFIYTLVNMKKPFKI